MITFSYNQDLKAGGFTALQNQLEPYSAKLQKVRASGNYADDESSMNLPNDEKLLEVVQAAAAQKATSKLRYHIVVGIGGSNLGTKAVYDALQGYADVLEPTRYPKLLFAETTNAEWLTQAAQLVDAAGSADEILVSVISKSGGTTETMANFEIIANSLKNKFANFHDRIVVITDEGSQLWQAAKEQAITTLTIPAKVGGRYSVFSAVGLFPLATIGVDIEALRAGARHVLDTMLPDAATSASLLEYYRREGKTINDNFMFHLQLESLGKWYRQLMGESIGKKQSRSGETVHAGMTPTVSLGSTDLHSVGQLYLGGPRDKFTTFVFAAHTVDISVPSERVFSEVNPMIDDRSASAIMSAILEGVQIAYKKAELPFAQITLDAIDEQSIGAYLQFKMIEMMYLGQLMNVNSFDQPSVEDYKVETKKILEAKGE